MCWIQEKSWQYLGKAEKVAEIPGTPKEMINNNTYKVGENKSWEKFHLALYNCK